jgi:hypothetical protein
MPAKAWLKGCRRKKTARCRRSITIASIGSKRAHPRLTVVLNGGVGGVEDALLHLARVDGVMMGRAAYQEPWRLLAVDPLVFGEAPAFASAKEAAAALIPYIERELAQRYAASRCHAASARPVPRRARCARAFRRALSPAPRRSPQAGAELLVAALALVADRLPDRDRRIGAHRRLTHGKHHRHMILGVPLSEIFWLALAVVVGGVITGDSCRAVRHRRRRGDRAGALRGFPHARRAGGGAYAALRRHLDCHHPADDDPLLSHAPRERSGHSARDQAVGAPRRDRRHLRRGDRGVCAARRVQARVRPDRDPHRHQIFVRRRSLESRHRPARHRCR